MKCPKCKADISEDSHFCSRCGNPLKDRADPLVTQTKTIQKPAISSGKTIAGKYKIIEEIGRGGMGVVYKTEDTRLDRIVALKFLSSELTLDEEAKQRFIQEAKAAAALNHPNISTIYEIDEHNGKTFIAMEYIQGKSLKQRLEEGPLEIDEAKDLAIKVAEGLREAHDKGIVHRDIKPANIMLTEKGQAKITDFGLAKLSGGADLTKASTIMGTVAYMSPEQAKGEAVDHRTDIWSLGAVLYEMLCGRRPFKKSHEQALIYEILNEEPVPITEYRSDIPWFLERVIQRSLKKSAKNRYQDIGEIITELKISPSVTLSKFKNSIAVLPFTNMSTDPEQEYFCDGMSEEIINALSHIKELKVVARTSAFAFKGKEVDIREVGEKLNVNAVLEGSVRKSGDRLRITAQLINVADGYHLWSERFDREMKDVFAIQDEVTLDIIDKLKVELLGGEKEQVIKRYTTSLEAHNLLLKNLYFRSRRTKEGLEKALECVQTAIDIDPTYALAYAQIADNYINLGFYGYYPPKDVYPKAKTAALKALETDSSLPQAYSALGWVSLCYDWDWIAAERAFKKALSLNPGFDYAHWGYATFLSYMGRLDDAFLAHKQALEIDPLSLKMNLNLGLLLRYAQKNHEAQEQIQRVIEMDPDFGMSYLLMGLIYNEREMYSEAVPEFQKAIELTGGLSWALAWLGYAYAMLGRKDETEKILHKIEERSKEEYMPATSMIPIFYALGDYDNVFACLERAIEEHDSIMSSIRIEPGFDGLRSDPRFQTILKKMGLD